MKHKIKKFLLYLLLLCVVLLILGLDNRLTVKAYQVQSDKVAETVRLLVVTDLHSCWYGEGQQELVAKIRELAPDAILYAGDIADDDMPHKGTIELLAALRDDYPAFYVTGNHEFWSGEVEAIKEMFCSYGVTVLEGNNVELEVKGQRLTICGVDDPDGHPRDVNLTHQEQLTQAFFAVDSEQFTVLLAHRPERIEEYLQYPVDLIVSGHAHGGQWRIPGILNGLLAPNQGFFPKYAGGLYSHGEVSHVVSRGLAKESTRVPRIFNPLELVVIELKPRN